MRGFALLSKIFCKFEEEIPKMMILKREDIRAFAKAAGFDLCGVARVREFSQEREFLKQWIEEGKSSSLEYLHRNIDKRADASILMEGARSVIVCAVSYKNEVSDGYPEDHKCKVASYACCRDYHLTIKEALSSVVESIKIANPDVGYRVFTDSAPIFEKLYAVEAGLGWIGRQSLLITPEFGSFVLLGEIVLDAEIDRYDEPYSGLGCGNCHRCIEVCPNHAVEEHHLDTRKCISRATIEKGEIMTLLHGWIFGCDECQTCCPYNKKASFFKNRALSPVFNPLEKDAQWWMNLSKEEFRLLFRETAMFRSGLQRIQQSVRKNQE